MRMDSGSSHERYPNGLDKTVEKRVQQYAKNIGKFLYAFDRYGTQKFRGRPDASLREMAAFAINDINRFMGTDRIPITDHYAVVTNYYARFEYKELEETVSSKNLSPDYEPPVELTYTAGFELVQRDFRNYEAIARDSRADNRRRYLRYAVTSEHPLMKPGYHARTLDIPMGMITSARFLKSSKHLALRVVGPSGERYGISIYQKGVEPIISGIYDKFGKEFGLDFGSLDDADSLKIDDTIYTLNNILE